MCYPPGSDNRTTVTVRGAADVPVLENANWDKRMSTVLVTVFGNKQLHVKPIIVFAGKGTRVSAREKTEWSPEVIVTFQVSLHLVPTACVLFCSQDEAIADRHTWDLLINEWNANVPKDYPKLLIYDHAPVHGLEEVKAKWRRMMVRRVLVPPGLTSYLQYIDVYFAATFKAKYSELFTEWLMTDQPLPNASQRRVLHTKWVAAAVRMTLATADVPHAFAQLGYTWLGTKPVCRGLEDYNYESPAEEEAHPILLPGTPDQPVPRR